MTAVFPCATCGAWCCYNDVIILFATELLGESWVYIIYIYIYIYICTSNYNSIWILNCLKRKYVYKAYYKEHNIYRYLLSDFIDSNCFLSRIIAMPLFYPVPISLHAILVVPYIHMKLRKK